MRFEVAQSLNGTKILYIARDTNGIVRLRANSLDEIHAAIQEYNQKIAEEAIKAKGKVKGKDEGKESTSEEIVEEKQEEQAVSSAPTFSEVSAEPEQIIEETAAIPPSEEPKKFLQNEIKEKVEEKKKRIGKKSFWDKLK